MKSLTFLPFVASVALVMATDSVVVEVSAPLKDLPSHVVEPAAAAQTHIVKVGGVKPNAAGGMPTPMLTYQPEAIQAQVGDVVEFEFYQANHTATQSTFENPCKAMQGGLDSGFMPNMEGTPGVKWQMTVGTSDPIWMYCKQRTGMHCGKGMVFSINAKPQGNTHESFKQLAIKTNGTELMNAPIVEAAPAPVLSTVTVAADAHATPVNAPIYNAAPTAPHSAEASVVAGFGQNQNGQCACSCLCGTNSFPAAAGLHAFGGIGGMIPS